MVFRSDIAIGCVVVVQSGQGTKRIQVLGLDCLPGGEPRKHRQPGRFRGFVLNGQEPPRLHQSKKPRCRKCSGKGCPDCQGDEFVDFSVDDCIVIEDQRFESIISQEIAA